MTERPSTPFLRFSRPVLREIAERRPLPDDDAIDADSGMEIDIETEFQRKIAGMRRLPRRERPDALRAAKAARQCALKALQEKRATERHAKRVRRRLEMPAPG